MRDARRRPNGTGAGFHPQITSRIVNQWPVIELTTASVLRPFMSVHPAAPWPSLRSACPAANPLTVVAGAIATSARRDRPIHRTDVCAGIARLTAAAGRLTVGLRWRLIIPLLIPLRRRVVADRRWVGIRRIIIRRTIPQPIPQPKRHARPPPTPAAATAEASTEATEASMEATEASMEAPTEATEASMEASTEAAAATSSGVRWRQRCRAHAGGKAQGDDRSGHGSGLLARSCSLRAIPKGAMLSIPAAPCGNWHRGPGLRPGEKLTVTVALSFASKKTIRSSIVPIKRSVHSIRESPAGNIPDRSYRSVHDPPKSLDGPPAVSAIAYRRSNRLPAIPAHTPMNSAAASSTNSISEQAFPLATSSGV
jgi:hypothetical protein